MEAGNWRILADITGINKFGLRYVYFTPNEVFTYKLLI
jgi:hypothetical protein